MNFIKHTKLWFSLSALLILPGLIALALWGLNLGIDFRGGTLIEIQFANQPDISTTTVTEGLQKLNLAHVTAQQAGQGTILLRTEPVNEEQHAAILATLTERVGENQEIRFESVGPTISQDLTRKAISAVVVASIAIILYIAWSFRGLPRPASSWRFGVSAVLALLHDLVFIIGAFAILGHYAHYEIDSLFITALLTIMGFSVHDTIVVFDRMRENLKRFPHQSFTETANISLTQTLGRSLGTSLTVLLVLLSLFLLGPETIQPFTLALILGITIGTFSSIFFATPLVVVWQNALARRKSA